jgi:hypothetical protein
MSQPLRSHAPTALITGASAGIGRELASAFAAHGYDLVVVARREAELKALAASLHEQHGVEVAVVARDLTDPSAAASILDAVTHRGIEVDVLVNNAGSSAHGDFADIPLERHLRLLQLNVTALTALTHLFVRPMIERRRGRVLNISSVSAFQPVPTLAVYAASKAFVLSFTEALAVELTGTGVTATACCPGFTATRMVRTKSATTGRAAGLPSLVIGDPKDVAREAYEACIQGDALQVTGLLNQAATLWMQHQPRWLGRTIGGLVRQWGR